MTQRLLFGICMLCNRPFTQVNRKKAVSRNEASPYILCKIIDKPLQRNARKVIFTQISAQSRNLDPNFRSIQ